MLCQLRKIQNFNVYLQSIEKTIYINVNLKIKNYACNKL